MNLAMGEVPLQRILEQPSRLLRLVQNTCKGLQLALMCSLMRIVILLILYI